MTKNSTTDKTGFFTVIVTPSHLKGALSCIGWGGPELARRIGVSNEFVSEMISGEHAIPKPVWDYVDAVARAVENCNGYPARELAIRCENNGRL